MGYGPNTVTFVQRRSSYRSIASLQRDCRSCRACFEAGFPIESQPIYLGGAGQRAFLIGQSPGSVEGTEGRPWRGRAGRTLRRWLELDDEQFYATFYCTSITRCYPGKSPSGRGDRLPTPREITLCRFWLDWELRLLQPLLIVTVGGLAARRVLGLTRLGGAVGQQIAFGHATAIPLPHPSGASGWLNDPANRRRVDVAASLIRAAIMDLGEGVLATEAEAPPAR